MITRTNTAVGRRLDKGDRGAATLETIGMYVVAAVLAVAVMLVLASATPVVGDRLRQALCMVTTLGQGSCESSVSSASDHIPTEPCVVSADGHTGAVEGGAIVMLGGSERFLVEKLNNGKYRVIRGTGSQVGTGAAVGANLSVTWNDKSIGAAAVAEANIAAAFSGGEVYYADNEEEVNNLRWAHSEAVAKDIALGGQLTPLRPLLDRAEQWLGVGNVLPPSAEVYLEGNVIADASAQATAATANAQAGVGAQMLLGMRVGADGTTTTSYQTSLEGKISAGTWSGDEQTNQTVYAKAGLEGKAEAIFEVERDNQGNITAVRVKSVMSSTTGASEKGGDVSDGPGEKQTYTEKVTTLPIRTANDQAIAQRYLDAAGLGPMGGFKDLTSGVRNYLPIANPLDALDATKAFAQAASLRGFVTQQSFDNGGSGSYGGTIAGDLVGKFGGSIDVKTVGRTSTGATYWDGTIWAPWKGCGPQ